MLGQLQSGDFSPHIGRPCRLECGGTVIETVLDAVDENPNDEYARAVPDARTPFTLLLLGAPDCPWVGGTVTLKIEGMAEVPDVYANRIRYPGPASLFQVVFN